MLAALGLSIVLGAQIGSHRGSHINLVAQNRLQAGVIPYGEEDGTRPTLADILTPGVSYTYHSPALHLAAVYQPRIYFEIVGPETYDRPLLLQQLSLQSDFTLSSRLKILGKTSLEAGDVDYTAVSAVFSPTITTLPALELVQWLHLAGNYSLEYQMSRTTVVGISGSGDFNSPLSDTSAEGLVRSATFGGSLFMSKVWNRRAFTRMNFPLTYSWFPEQVLFIMATPSLAHEHALSRTTSLDISLGMAAIYIIDSQEFTDLDQGDVNISPIASIELEEFFYSGIENIFRAHAYFTYQWVIDPILARPFKRAESGFGITWWKEPVLELGAQLSFSTSLPGATYEGSLRDDQVPRNDQGALSLKVPFETEINQHFKLTASLTSTLRGPSLFEGYRPELIELLGSIGVKYSLERKPRP